MIEGRQKAGSRSERQLEATTRTEDAPDTESLAAITVGCERSLQDNGIIGALRFLNVRTRYRYTGLYHADPPMLRNVQLFDRENPHLNVSGEVKPLTDTYCGVVLKTNSPLRTADVAVIHFPRRQLPGKPWSHPTPPQIPLDPFL